MADEITVVSPTVLDATTRPWSAGWSRGFGPRPVVAAAQQMTVKEGSMHSLSIAKGEDRLVVFRVLSHERVELAARAPAGATSLVARPLAHAIEDGDRLLFGANTVLEVGTTALPGSTALTVSALPGPLAFGAMGHKIRNLDGQTLQIEILRRASDEEPLITKDVVITDTADGLCQFEVLGEDTEDLDVGSYFGAFWCRDPGNAHLIAPLHVQVYPAGFLGDS